MGWRRTARRSAWWCTFDPALFAAQEAAERTPPIPALAGVPYAEGELKVLRAYGAGSTYEAEQLLQLVRAVQLNKDAARKLLADGVKALDTDGCPKPDAVRLRGELERAIADQK